MKPMNVTSSLSKREKMRRYGLNDGLHNQSNHFAGNR
jgi:hypothetical protein